MKLFNWLLLIGLTCSLLTTMINVGKTDTDWMDWINIFGCVALGAHIREMFFETKWRISGLQK